MSTKPFFAARIEEVIDRVTERVLRAAGWREHVIAYTGYGSLTGARVLGRIVLAPRRARTQLGKVTEDFVKRRGFRNFLTAPCVRARAKVKVGDQIVEVTADRGGYFDVRIRNHGLQPGWQHAAIQSAGSKRSLAQVLIVDPEVDFGVVCDIDDTILTTFLPRPLIAAWNSFIKDESKRQAVPGMAVMLSTLLAEHPGAPIIYLSTGAWNTHDFLHRFIKRHAYPTGPMLLTDWGPTNTGFFRSGQAHKRESLMQLTLDFPFIRWVLVGDDGQHDPALYSQFARLEPRRVRAIAIRQLTATEQILAHFSVTALEELDTGNEVPMVAAPDGRGLLVKLHGILGETKERN